MLLLPDPESILDSFRCLSKGKRFFSGGKLLFKFDPTASAEWNCVIQQQKEPPDEHRKALKQDRLKGFILCHELFCHRLGENIFGYMILNQFRNFYFPKQNIGKKLPKTVLIFALPKQNLYEPKLFIRSTASIFILKLAFCHQNHEH